MDYHKCDKCCCFPDIVYPDCYEMYLLKVDRCEDITDPAILKRTKCDAVLAYKAKLAAENDATSNSGKCGK